MLGLLIGMALIGSTWAPAAVAAESVSLQFAPSSLTLAPGDLVKVGLVLTNPTQTPVRITGVEFATSPHIVATWSPGSAVSGVVSAGGSALGEVEVHAQFGFQDADVAAIAAYQPTGSAAPASRIATASLTVKAGTSANVPEVSFITSPQRLNDGQDQAAVVRIANPTPFAYQQVTILALDGDDVDVDIPGPPTPPFVTCQANTSNQGPAIACLDRLLPGASHLLDVRVRAHESVRTGRQRVGVVLTGTRDTGTAGDAMPAATVVSTADVELAVFGVDALSPFGVGTLFVLPGLLAVIVFLLLARAVYPRATGLPDTVEIKDLRILPIVVPLAALAYLIAWLVLGSNLTEKTSTLGVAALFLIGICIGLLLWAVVAFAWYRHSGRKHFLVGDSPRTVLMRLEARRARLQLPQFTSNNMNYMYLAPGPDGKLLASPQMVYVFTEKMQGDDAGRAAFQSAVQNDDIGVIRQSQRDGKVTIRWNSPTGVVAIDGAGVQMPGSGPLLIETQ